MSSFTVAQEEAIGALQALWGPDRVVLIGGAALAALTGMSWRTTLDIDLVVAVEPEAANQGLSSLTDWRKDPDHEPRWVYGEAVPVDVLPITPEILRTGTLRWQRSGAVMSAAGLELVHSEAVTVRLSGGGELRVASMPVLAVLKMASFLDRPHDRTRDLADIAWIMHTYVSDLDDRRFDLRFDDLDVQYDEGSAFLFGERLRAAAEHHSTLIGRFLETVDRSWLDAMTALAPAAWGRDTTATKRQLRAFGLGFRGAPR